MPLRIVSPSLNSTFTVTATPSWPSIVFKTDGAGAHKWSWKLAWKSFERSGTVNTNNNQWDAVSVITNLGGTLTVSASAGSGVGTVAVKIIGKNPTAAEVTTFLNTKPDGGGFDKILTKESKALHFNEVGEPIKSHDNGYGIAQLTNPAPSFDQAWNWKLNIEGGLKLFKEKVAAARVYLSQSNRTYTAMQLKYEAVCRWNGGRYHVWDGKKWVRNSSILCDVLTGNVGWDMTDPENSGKSAATLRARDKGSYPKAPDSKAHWHYSGVCYADRLLG